MQTQRDEKACYMDDAEIHWVNINDFQNLHSNNLKNLGENDKLLDTYSQIHMDQEDMEN